ncbi:MAG: hypothetical protein WCJ02_01815 [bacterium]
MKTMDFWCCMLFSLAMTLSSMAVESNVCYNSSFDSEKGNFDGWNINFDWTANSHQTGNHLNVSYLPEFKGKKNVLKMKVPAGYESKVETPLIPYKMGDRYKCTFDIFIEDVNLKILFQGYNLKPGIPPSDKPLMQDLRRSYKAENIDAAKGASWKTVTVEFPMLQVSETAATHLKKVRYITVLMYVPGATYGAGNFYVSNMKITKLPVPFTVKKEK